MNAQLVNCQAALRPSPEPGLDAPEPSEEEDVLTTLQELQAIRFQQQQLVESVPIPGRALSTELDQFAARAAAMSEGIATVKAWAAEKVCSPTQ